MDDLTESDIYDLDCTYYYSEYDEINEAIAHLENSLDIFRYNPP